MTDKECPYEIKVHDQNFYWECRLGEGVCRANNREQCKLFNIYKAGRKSRDAEVERLEEALEWALDIINLTDEYLASIDGKESVYTPTHIAGKTKARKVLERYEK
jgi:hypothetical protein